MKKKVSYLDMLKQAVSEYDASNMDYKGPMLDNIISYDGYDDGNELKTHKDASDILDSKYVQEKNSEFAYFLKEDAQEQEPEQNEIETGDTPDDIDDTFDDLEDFITDDEDGSFDTEFVTRESIEETILARLIQEMEGSEDVGPDNAIELPEDEEGDQAGQDAFDKEDDGLEDFLKEDIDFLDEDGVEDDFATPNHPKEEDDLNDVEDAPLDIQEAIDLLEEDLAFIDEESLLEDLLFEEDDEHEKAETSKEEEAEHEEGGEEEGEEEDKEKKEPLDVDSGIVKKEGRGMGPIMITKEELLEEAYRIFREQVEEEIKKEEGPKEKKVEDDEDKDEDGEGEEVSDEDIEKKIAEALQLEDIDFLDEDLLFEDEQEEEPEQNEIVTGDTPDKVEATKDDLEDQLLEALLLMEEIDDVEVPEEKEKDEEDGESEEGEGEGEDEKEKVKECNEDFVFDEDLDYLTEDEDIIDEILNSL